MKSRKSNRTRYFLHRVNLHLPGKVSCLSTGLTGSRNNPENCHYLVENISTVKDINKENLLLYPVWLLCWICWVLACFKTATNHPSSYLKKSIFLWKLEDGPSGSQYTLILIKFNTRTTLDKQPSHAESHNFVFYKLELGVIAKIESCENDFEYEYGLKSFSYSYSLLMLTSSIIWLQPTALNIYTFAVLFFLKFALLTYSVSHHCYGRALYAWDTVFYGFLWKSSFFGVERRRSTVHVEICQKWHVGLDGFRWYPAICHASFASSVCLPTN